VTIWAAKLWYF